MPKHHPSANIPRFYATFAASKRLLYCNFQKFSNACFTFGKLSIFNPICIIGGGELGDLQPKKSQNSQCLGGQRLRSFSLVDYRCNVQHRGYSRFQQRPPCLKKLGKWTKQNVPRHPWQKTKNLANLLEENDFQYFFLYMRI